MTQSEKDKKKSNSHPQCHSKAKSKVQQFGFQGNKVLLLFNLHLSGWSQRMPRNKKRQQKKNKFLRMHAAAALADRERTFEDVGQLEEPHQQPEPGLAFVNLLKLIVKCFVTLFYIKSWRLFWKTKVCCASSWIAKFTKNIVDWCNTPQGLLGWYFHYLTL